MSNIRIAIDGKTVMDSDPGQWSTQPPDLASLQNLGGGAQPQPWMQAIMITLAKVATEAMAGVKGGDTSIEVTTRAGGWTMDVQA
jgi:hypothetical protein